MAQLNSTFVIVVCIAIILLYTSLGGLASVIYTDIIQVGTTILGMVSYQCRSRCKQGMVFVFAEPNWWKMFALLSLSAFSNSRAFVRKTLCCGTGAKD